jgi:succinate dehydrogenase / fumarate reductase iron-sulfur subunit
MGDNSKNNMTLRLRIWRQSGPGEAGRFMDFEARNVSPDMSFLEMMDVVNEELSKRGDRPVEFDHDCREGICGSCSMVINGSPHGPHRATTTCQLHMRHFRDGDHVTIEPFRAKAFPVVRDLVVDRSAFDRIQQAGGYISVNTGNAPDANSVAVPKDNADRAFGAATCIGCGACVAACKNASASLFVAAKVAHLSLLPQGEAERDRRALNMVAKMDEEGFGACSNTGACSAACPKEIPLEHISRLNREYVRASLVSRPKGE